VIDSRIPGFHRLGVAERIDVLVERKWLDPAAAATLKGGGYVLPVAAGNRMIENVIGTFGLPVGIAPNFVVDDKPYLVPLVVEEPSVVAALSNAARLVRGSGGFRTHCHESLLIGQVHLAGIEDAAAAARAITAAADRLVEEANAVHPRLLARGGGVRGIESRALATENGEPILAVHVLVDTCDAMGANLVNTICESMAQRFAEVCGGEPALCILSNLADRSVVTATCEIALSELGESPAIAAEVRDAIVRANDIAFVDPYRASTHNKGIMNGIDPLAIATGNDWRAIEAGAHAYAARDGQYRALTRWQVGERGELRGRLRMPLKVGIVGGTLELNPAAALLLQLTGADSATELGRLMVAVGLAQNFSALRALVTTGIQAGHMALHARGVAAAAGTPDAMLDDVVVELIESGEIKEWKARDILASRSARGDYAAAAAGKAILFGEHAAVYGRHALALPIAAAVRATVTAGAEPLLSIPAWGVSEAIPAIGEGSGLLEALDVIRRELDITESEVGIRVDARLPRAMGLGSSASLAVAIVRAFDAAYGLDLDDDRVNSIAYAAEELAHGTPSGIDNTVATYAAPVLFRKGEPAKMQNVAVRDRVPIVIACSHSRGLTAEQVKGVRGRYRAASSHYDAMFDSMDRLSIDGAAALAAADWERLGSLMNICHGLLNAIEVSTPELERMVAIARSAGAIGAKLTGAGGGGSILALCPGTEQQVIAALESAGFPTFNLTLGDSTGD